MATIINSTPRASNAEDTAWGAFLVILVLLVLGFLFFAYALPALRNSAPAPATNNPDINIELPPLPVGEGTNNPAPNNDAGPGGTTYP